MNPVSQFDLHPDAELLNGFAEHALPEHEHAEVLTHLASCGRCREIVHLAQDAELVAEPARAAAAAPGYPDAGRVAVVRRKSWFVWWPVAGFAAVALASLVIAGVLLERRYNAAPLESARVAQAPAPVMTQPVVPAQPESGARDANVNALKTLKMPAQASTRVVAPRTAPGFSGGQGAGSGAAGGRLAPAATDGLTTPPPAPGDAASTTTQLAVQNRVTSNSMQQNSMANVARSRAANNRGPSAPQQSQNSQIDALNSPLLASPAPKAIGSSSSSGDVALGASTETVVVSADAAAVDAAKPELPAPLTLDEQQISDFKTPKAGIAGEKKTPLTMLPNGLPLVSTAAAGQVTVAVDAAGGLFLSRDQGKSWQPVTQQWSGRALKVQLAKPARSRSGFLSGITGRNKETPANHPAAGPAVFELVSGDKTVWTSADGATWSAK